MKKVLIVFPDIHLPYSPTTLNLFYELKKKFDVTLICPKPESWFSLQKIDDFGINYFENIEEQTAYSGLLQRGLNKFKRWYKPPTNEVLKTRSLINAKARKIMELVKDFEGEIIAVDFFALWCVQQAGKKAHLISLEINDHDVYREACDFSKIKSLIIQSQERYEYLFGNNNIKHFLVQNAPPYIDFVPAYESRKVSDLIYCGSATIFFGIITCLDFLRDYPDFTLTIKGVVPKETADVIDQFYNDLVDEGRLILNDDYLDPISLTRYVSGFRIGFAFYDFYRFEAVRKFNYYTAPSGKVFQYLNSGVPIIANRIPGFNLIKQKNAGVLVTHLSSVAIKSAVDQIEADYYKMAENSKNGSFDFDFSRNISPFVQSLISEN